MPTVYIDDQEVVLGDDERINGIQAAGKLGIDIPHYCWHPGLSVVASCRMCLVETGRRDPKTGEVSMLPKLVPACQTPATDNTVFVTDSENIRAARAMVEEHLLIRHPIDCPICDKAGECYLQDYHFEHGQAERRADLKPFTSRRRPVGETVTLFVDRCVMCSRCVRFCREITGTSELMVINRGAHEEIDVFPGYPLSNKLSGNVVDLCPVGALGDKDFLYTQRVWFMKGHDHVCANCSTGCSIRVEENQDQIYRLKPRENPHVNQWWICDEGRYGYHHVHSPQRLVDPLSRAGDQVQSEDWSAILERVADTLSRTQRWAAILSPFLTVEEAYLLATLLKQEDPHVLLGCGPIPRVGQDEVFPNGFVIHAEKCPNRLGVQSVVARFGGETKFDTFVDRVEESSIDAIWITGGYDRPWVTEPLAQLVASVPTSVVQDILPSDLLEYTTFLLPGVAYPERAGSFVNYQHRLQSFDWAIRPPSGAMMEGQVYWRLLQRPGMYNAPSIMQDVAREIGYFAAAAGPISDLGVDLNSNKLAGAPIGAEV